MGCTQSWVLGLERLRGEVHLGLGHWGGERPHDSKAGPAPDLRVPSPPTGGAHPGALRPQQLREAAPHVGNWRLLLLRPDLSVAVSPLFP